ncbi:MAG TPA: deoxyguanosinetriphosphate triphosphohydrolase [Rhodocyclaceae bacterium]|nr:deoxyguanosinetriphosphate triphosphohydrolase [Rhodocyclaceae bacterium]HMZ82794.1 deoxyguanosinetriphosphate triphosphohydrolase [Rhodocyclaceae bacterium]HNA02471.1 deoxyguanosinetriphosphate triphosphohydrolase [Rhodocyclaceae bacterium]HNB78860.1 deoxyguanosinetriphosphate triphosphohydrolase [Rhodocyclaceae bacterium]HNC60916.1 deoxyguanosinetriphosphate triphosphohydrolase [Rhodocyclaceae bacterium]
MISLASFAVTEANSRGRQFSEMRPSARSEFQRDRDRIVHSTAFRRLEYKTQVFVNHEGDLFRTRLTHSIEVAQIARSIARALRLNEDLAEAISLSHDLGHTPFGHAGQDALNTCMKDYGGFEHNLQSLRTVDLLEERYGAFDGLNLCYETREGILKHCSVANARSLGDLGRRFIEKTQPSLEAQICNLADEIAYNNHDVDDGLRSGLISLQQLESVRVFQTHAGDALAEYPGLSGRRLIHETTRRMINAQVLNLVEQSCRNVSAAAVESLDDVHCASPLIAFGAEMAEANRELKLFLRDNLYRHYQVLRMTNKAQRIIADLFGAFMSDPRLLPPQYQERASGPEPAAPWGPDPRARAVADYVAGMTDRYAMREHRRLFAVGEIH